MVVIPDFNVEDSESQGFDVGRSMELNKELEKLGETTGKTNPCA